MCMAPKYGLSHAKTGLTTFFFNVLEVDTVQKTTFERT